MGGSDTVTGSCQHLEWLGGNFLVDAGLFQGVDEKKHKNQKERVIDAKMLDAVFLTHAHLDHCGYLPRLAYEGLNCPIYCSRATRDLAELVMLDSASIMQNDAKSANKGVVKEKFRKEPLYRTQDVQRVLNLMRVVDWEEERTHAGISFSFQRAGHIPGAASVAIWPQGETDRKILFSGDLGRDDDLLVLPPEVRGKFKAIVMESTYGNRIHTSRDAEDSSFQLLPELIKRIKGKRSIMLIPSFSIARSQMILFLLKKMMEEDKGLKVPVYMDSPMGLKANELFTKHHHELKLGKEEMEALFLFCQTIKESWEETSREKEGGPQILISSSGMLTGGKVMEHLKEIAPEKNNILFFPGYLGDDTLGRQIADGAKLVSVTGDEIEIECEVYQAKDLSSHADSVQLEKWLEPILSKDGNVWLNHGSLDSREALKAKLEAERNWKVSLIPFQESVELFSL